MAQGPSGAESVLLIEHVDAFIGQTPWRMPIWKFIRIPGNISPSETFKHVPFFHFTSLRLSLWTIPQSHPLVTLKLMLLYV